MQSEESRARHDLRGKLNALKLCVSALYVAEAPAEAIEFLDYIINGTDKVNAAMDAMLAAMQTKPADEQSQS